MYTAAGNLLLEIQVIPVRTTAKYLHHLSYSRESLLAEEWTPLVVTEVPESLK